METSIINAVKIAEYLLKIKAIKINSQNYFKWSSGWNSPIYCDNRISLSHPNVRKHLTKSMAERILIDYPTVKSLCGVATAGIAIGALVADNLDLPYAYCRPKPKAHGMKNQLEGHLNKQDPIVVVEDLISTGGSSIKVVEFLRTNGYNVIGMASIFTYGFDIAESNFKNINCPCFSLSNYETLINNAAKTGYISKNDIKSLLQWRENPSNWGK